MYNVRAPLNELLKKDKTWRWAPECQAAFERIKETLTSDLSLSHYDPKLDILVTSDASSYGIGACILHTLPGGTRRAIAHAYRSLLPAEKQYSQIEKEALGIIFVVTKFHRYLHGRQVTLQTDHKPLLSIFGSKKGLPVYYCQQTSTLGYHTIELQFQIEYLSSKNMSCRRVIPTCSEEHRSIRGFNYRNVKK